MGSHVVIQLYIANSLHFSEGVCAALCLRHDLRGLDVVSVGLPRLDALVGVCVVHRSPGSSDVLLNLNLLVVGLQILNSEVPGLEASVLSGGQAHSSEAYLVLDLQEGLRVCFIVVLQV